MSSPMHVAVEVCPVCGNTRRLFTCSSCIATGNFVSSDQKSPYGNARYSERQKRLRLLISLKERKGKEVLLHAEKNARLSDKRDVLGKLQLRVDVLKCAVRLAESQLDQRKLCLKAATTRLEDKESSIAVSKERLKEAQGIIDMRLMKSEIEKVQHKLTTKSQELQSRRRQFMRHLTSDIFPIATHAVLPEFGTPPRHTIATQISNVDVVLERSVTAESDLEEATRTAYVGGRWISEQESTESEYCILDSCLPPSGDYYKYYEWLKSQRSLGRSEDSSSSDHALPLLAIPAALGYTAQLVEQIASCLDINLTAKAHHSEFCVHAGARKKFFDAVNRLNTSVMYICSTQGVAVSALNPLRPLKNLDACLSSTNSSLGRSGPFETHTFDIPECPFDSDSSVEELTFDSSESDSTEEPGDWDSLIDLPDVPDATADISNTRAASRDGDTSSMTASDLTTASSRLVTSAAASVAALWPWKKQ